MLLIVRKGIEWHRWKWCQYFQVLSCKSEARCLYMSATYHGSTNAQSMHCRCMRSVIPSSSKFRPVALHNCVSKHGTVHSYCSCTDNLNTVLDRENSDNPSEDVTFDVRDLITNEEAEAIATSPVEVGAIVTSPVEAGAIVTSPVYAGAIVTSPVEAEAIATLPVETRAIVTSPVEVGAIVTSPVEAGAIVTSPVEVGAIVTSPVETGAIVTSDYEEITNSFNQNLVNKNLRHLQNLLACSDEDLATLVANHPNLRNLEILKHINEKVEVLLGFSLQKKHVYMKFKTLCKYLIFIDSRDLMSILDIHFKNVHSKEAIKLNSFSNVIKRYVNVKGKDNMEVLSELLNVPKSDLLLITGWTVLNVVSHKYSACFLRSKVDFLLREGLSTTEIAFNLKLLTLPLHILSERIIDMKATLGKISIPALYTTSPLARYFRKKDQIHQILGCSKKNLSHSARIYLDSFDSSAMYEVLLLLLELGFSKEELVRNVFILGYKSDVVREAFYANVGQVAMTTSDGRNLILNLMIYDIEYGNNSVVL